MNFIETLRAAKHTAKTASKNCPTYTFFIHSKIIIEYNGSIEGRRIEKTYYSISNYSEACINHKYIGFFYRGKFSK